MAIVRSAHWAVVLTTAQWAVHQLVALGSRICTLASGSQQRFLRQQARSSRQWAKAGLWSLFHKNSFNKLLFLLYCSCCFSHVQTLWERIFKEGWKDTARHRWDLDPIKRMNQLSSYLSVVQLRPTHAIILPVIVMTNQKWSAARSGGQTNVIGANQLANSITLQ